MLRGLRILRARGAHTHETGCLGDGASVWHVPCIADASPGVDRRQSLYIEQPALRYIKQDLPFALPLDTIAWPNRSHTPSFPIYAARSQVMLTRAEALATFDDGSPAITSARVGRGRTYYCGFLPGLSYFQPAIPQRPVDRGGTIDDAFTHFVPTQFSRPVSQLIGLPARKIERDILASEPLVETGLIESNAGAVIPLVNFSGGAAHRLRIRAKLPVRSAPTVTLASGNPVHVRREGPCRWTFTLDLDIADALVVRAPAYGTATACR
ncbi:MAG: hypothetical protein JW940_09015 [Polyangiaceae bacterium]|nr:hypothetical protein [Polyangiaceae bacterium]